MKITIKINIFYKSTSVLSFLFLKYTQFHCCSSAGGSSSLSFIMASSYSPNNYSNSFFPTLLKSTLSFVNDSNLSLIAYPNDADLSLMISYSFLTAPLTNHFSYCSVISASFYYGSIVLKLGTISIFYWLLAIISSDV